jgi:hypothetical protein
MRNGIDPQNGQVVGDIWERIGADGLPTLVMARYAFADGRLDQATLITRTTTTSVYGPAYAAVRHPPSAPPNPRWCVVQGPLIFRGSDSQAAYTNYLTGLLPSFVDEEVLAHFGFTMSLGRPTDQLPTTTTLVKATLLQTYGSAATLRQWSIQVQDPVNNVVTFRI